MSHDTRGPAPAGWRHLPPDPVDDSWRVDALCLEVGDLPSEDPENSSSLFHPGADLSSLPARAVCMLCEVRAECLADAMEPDTEYGTRAPEGVRGGLTSPQRKKILTGERKWPEDLVPPAGTRWARAQEQDGAA